VSAPIHPAPVGFLVVGGGPAGVAAATTAASLGARVSLVEKSIIGGAAHLWDCIPSKTMAATAIRADSIRNAAKFGLVAEPGRINPAELAERIQTISSDITKSWVSCSTPRTSRSCEGEDGSRNRTRR
jgi:NAD(P)H dehydrogenase (quinone)